MITTLAPPRLEWTNDDESNRLIANDPMALLIGFCLDQQITVEKAFTGPVAIRERLGTLDAAELARIDAGNVEKAFATPPAIHRFPASMSRRVQALCALVATQYDNDATALWRTAADAADLKQRIRILPGFGPLKADSVLAVLVKHFGVKPAGWEGLIPTWPTLADVTTAEQRREYQAQKRAHKARIRAEATAKAKPSSARRR